MSWSDDKGLTWSAPHIVIDAAKGGVGGSGVGDTTALSLSLVMPTLAVNRDGVVGLMWYDYTDQSNPRGYHVRFAASLDGGETWLAPVDLSSASATVGKPGERWALGIRGERSIARRIWVTGGHTAGLAADANGAFHGLWVDNRSGIAQVWTAPARVAR